MPQDLKEAASTSQYVMELISKKTLPKKLIRLSLKRQEQKYTLSGRAPGCMTLKNSFR